MVYVVAGVVTGGVASGVCRDWRCYRLSFQWCMSWLTLLQVEFLVVYVVAGVGTGGVSSGVCRDWRCYR